MEKPSPSSPAELPAGKAPAPTRDPVCGMDVDPERPPGGVVRRGRYAYSFCSEACRRRFEADPMARTSDVNVLWYTTTPALFAVNLTEPLSGAW